MPKARRAERSSRKNRGTTTETAGEKVIRWIQSKCHIPEGRDVGKKVVLRDWQKRELLRIYDNPAGTRRAILSFGRKNGKGLALNTPIATPRGWTTMGKLRRGDEVFGSDGQPTRVDFVSHVHLGLKCWRLTFSDGSQIVADEEHRWLTRHSFRPWDLPRRNSSGNGGRWITSVVTTPQIAASVYRQRKDGKREHNHKITVAPATVSEDIVLPIDPYVLGVWLGDGTSTKAEFTSGEQDLQHMVQQLSAGLGGDVRVRHNTDRAASICAPRLGFLSALRSIGVLGNKHIPQNYLDAGTSQRWALLQGLMDTDGTVSQHSGQTTPRASFTGMNEELCRGVWKLARSLGLKATWRSDDAKIRQRVVGTAYEVSFAADYNQPIFRLTRKQALLPLHLGQRSSTLAIVACEEVPSVPTVCIKVAAEDSLFLAGDGCIPTHNTALAAFILLVHLCGPRHVPNSQLYSAAQSRDQAAILFGLAAKCVRMSPLLIDAVNVVESQKRLVCSDLGTSYRALSADASTAYGLSPALTIHDELGQVQGPKSELYEALETATAAQEEPLSIIISTQAPTDADLLSVLIDDALEGHDPHTVVSLYTAPAELDPFSEEAIRAANPAFGDFQNADEVRAMANDAKRMPSREPDYQNLILNRRCETKAPFISKALWDSCGGPIIADFGKRPVWGALDLSETNDLTALVIGADVEGVWHVKPTFWIPGEGIRERSRKDRVPYDLWCREGYIEVCDGKSIEYEFVARYLRECFKSLNIQKIAFDRWNWRHFKPWLLKAGFSEAELEAHFLEFGQGFMSMSPALRDTESAILNGKLRHGNHPVLNMCAANAVVQKDPAGNRKLNKAKSHGRIDGMVCLTMLMGAVPDQVEVKPTPKYQMLFVG